MCLKMVHQRDRVERTRKRGKQKKEKRSISNEKWGKDHDGNSIKRGSQLSPLLRGKNATRRTKGLYHSYEARIKGTEPTTDMVSVTNFDRELVLWGPAIANVLRSVL
jgi:hypothetical protein